ncbi:MAG: hypothetical protein K1X66_09655 [Verrucomicrobiae bacterium]|nr:hypothetical protein [Verrucomicrobiae bacterium]
MKRRLIILEMFCLCASYTLFAQAPDTAPAAPTTPAASAPTESTTSDSKLLGKDLPFFNPGNEIVTWDGKNWNISDNRVFRARFEKYLNAPEQTSQDDVAYQKIIDQILEKLAPKKVNATTLDEAWALLPEASNYKSDAHLCDSLSDAVYASWLAKEEIQRLTKANETLDRQKSSIEWNMKMAVQNQDLEKSPPKNPFAAAEWAKEQELKRTTRTQPYLERLADINTRLLANRTKKEASELQTKIEFQALIVQFFLQRRFQHVVIANRFYRSIFGDGDTQLRVDDPMKNLLTQGSGLPATIGLLDSMANEAMRDVTEGVDAFNFLLEKEELASATQRLQEAFTVGEYLPAIRTLSRDKKRQALDFAQKSNQLISALEVKDYTLAENLVNELEKMAKDFDKSKPLAAIETAKTVSGMHLAKARTAAVSGDRATLETELKNAMEIWPRNPELAKVSGAIFEQTDIQQQALVDLERLMSQKNYRQIYEDRVRFIAAAALYPEKQEKLATVLENMQLIESSIIRANEISKRGDYAGAWESVEKVFQQFPDDNKLNQVRADLTTQAADFVRSLRTAQDLEKKEQTGSSLAWYLKAQRLYPPSEFAKEGIARLVKNILPEES